MHITVKQQLSEQQIDAEKTTDVFVTRIELEND